MLGVYTLQILAHASVANASGSSSLVTTRPLIDRQIVNVDLIPHALREDQRRLPPGLTDRGQEGRGGLPTAHRWLTAPGRLRIVFGE